MATLIHKLERRVEQALPFVLGVVAFAATMLCGADAIRFMVEAKWNVPSIYASVFQLTSIITAFLFAFYTFFLTTDRGFIGRTKHTVAYRRTIEYTISALLLGAVLTVASIVMILVNWTPTTIGWELAFVAGWFGLTIWALATFTRAAIVFSIFASEHR